jgi:glycosyltransferase A (GT-A) superfamily protein (DUF2064 family)
MKGVVAVFAKPPVPGRVKTRLAPVLGDVAAAALARSLFEQVWAAIGALPWARPVVATVDDPSWPAPREAWLQGEGDLGARVERILRRGLAEGPWVMAVGADSPGLPLGALGEARAWVEGEGPRAAVGPAEDGGFWLLAVNRCPDLAGLPWSRPNTRAATVERLLALGFAVIEVAPWFDVDEPDDLRRLQAQVP